MHPTQKPPPKLRSHLQIPNFRLCFSGKPTRIPKFRSQSQFHVSRCNPLRSSNSGANFKSEHLPGLQIQIPKCRCQFQIMFEHIHLRYPNSGLKSQITQSRFSHSGVKFQIITIQVSNFRFQFQIPISDPKCQVPKFRAPKNQVPISDPVVPCLSICWKRDDNSASTQVPKFRSQFQNSKSTSLFVLMSPI